jgi:hypothetical protein
MAGTPPPSGRGVHLWQGNTLIVWRLNRLGRSLKRIEVVAATLAEAAKPVIEALQALG